MRIECPACNATLNAPERLIGKRVKCPRCGDPVAVEDPNPPIELEDFVEDESEDEPPPPPRSRAAATQTCPMCGAKNNASASQCKDCGEELTSESTAIGEGLWRDGKKLVMLKTAELPYRCIKTNQPADGWLRRKLHWHHPAVFLTLLAGLLIYVIIVLCVQKKANIRIGLCQAWFRRRRWGIAIAWLSALTGMGLCIGGCAGIDTPDNNMGWVILAGLVVGFVGTIAGLMISSVISPTKITDEYVWLKGVHPDFLESLPEWDIENERPRKRKRR